MPWKKIERSGKNLEFILTKFGGWGKKLKRRAPLFSYSQVFQLEP
jgi:hypothetical protein